jgi:small subunit ribosomal protein S20
MAITKSAKKAYRQSLRRKARNTEKKDDLKKLLKEVRSLISEKKANEAKKLLPKVYKLLDKGAKKGIIKKGTASRKKSRIAKAISKSQ